MNKKIILTLCFFSLLFYIITSTYHPELRVGIIGNNNVSQKYFNVIEEGFETYYPDHFEVIILNDTYNLSNIRINESYYLNDDFFTEISTLKTNDKYDLDFTLIITKNKIKNWLDGGYGVWGQANSETNSALMTISYWDLVTNKKRIQGVAIHEIFHLLGYVHNPFDKNGIMKYVAESGEFELESFYKPQLSYRTSLVRIFRNVNFYFLYMSMNILWALLFLPILLLIQEILFDMYKINKNKRFKLSILPIFASLLTMISYNYTWYLFMFSFLVLFGINMGQIQYLKEREHKKKLN